MSDPIKTAREALIRVARAIEKADQDASREAEGAANGLPDDVSDWGVYLAHAALSAAEAAPTARVKLRDLVAGMSEDRHGEFPTHQSEAEDHARAQLRAGNAAAAEVAKRRGYKLDPRIAEAAAHQGEALEDDKIPVNYKRFGGYASRPEFKLMRLRVLMTGTNAPSDEQWSAALDRLITIASPNATAQDAKKGGAS